MYWRGKLCSTVTTIGSYMAHDLNSTPNSDFGSPAINDLLPERPAIIGEFNSDYEPFRVATLADLAPMTKYEFLLAQQLVD